MKPISVDAIAPKGATTLFAICMVVIAPTFGQTGADYDLSWTTIDGGGVMFSTGGDFGLFGTIGQPDAGEMTGGIYTLTGGFWFGQVPGECSATGVRSYRDHGPVGPLGLDMGISAGVEPRLGGIVELEIDLDDAGGAGTSATVTCSARAVLRLY